MDKWLAKWNDDDDEAFNVPEPDEADDYGETHVLPDEDEDEDYDSEDDFDEEEDEDDE